jgi:hypothetical protein
MNISYNWLKQYIDTPLSHRNSRGTHLHRA